MRRIGERRDVLPDSGFFEGRLRRPYRAPCLRVLSPDSFSVSSVFSVVNFSWTTCCQFSGESMSAMDSSIRDCVPPVARPLCRRGGRDPDLALRPPCCAKWCAAERPLVRVGHSVQRPDRRRSGNPGLVHAGLRTARSNSRSSRHGGKGLRRELSAPVVSMVSYAIIYSPRPGAVSSKCASGRAWPGPDCAGPAGRGGRPSGQAICRKSRFQPDPIGHADNQHASAPLRIAGDVDRLFVLCLGHRHHRRADSPAGRAWRKTSPGCRPRRPACRSVSALA